MCKTGSDSLISGSPEHRYYNLKKSRNLNRACASYHEVNRKESYTRGHVLFYVFRTGLDLSWVVNRYWLCVLYLEPGEADETSVNVNRGSRRYSQKGGAAIPGIHIND